MVQTIAVTPFNQLILDTRKTRNAFAGSLRAAASSMSPAAEGILAWVSPRRGEDVIGKGYNNSAGIYHGSEYYRESLLHLALSGCVDTFIYYHGWGEMPWNETPHRRLRAQLRGSQHDRAERGRARRRVPLLRGRHPQQRLGAHAC